MRIHIKGRWLFSAFKLQDCGGGLAEIDGSGRSVSQAFVISHTTFLAAQDDETG
jgi:hypothetical protein